MRVCSAAEIKGHGRRSGEPREGSRLRAIYDLLLTHRGDVVEFDAKKHDALVRSYLGDFYGMEIESSDGRARGQTGKVRRWRLVGEWLGSQYVDYRGSYQQLAAKPGDTRETGS